METCLKGNLAQLVVVFGWLNDQSLPEAGVGLRFNVHDFCGVGVEREH